MREMDDGPLHLGMMMDGVVIWIRPGLSFAALTNAQHPDLPWSRDTLLELGRIRSYQEDHTGAGRESFRKEPQAFGGGGQREAGGRRQVAGGRRASRASKGVAWGSLGYLRQVCGRQQRPWLVALAPPTQAPTALCIVGRYLR